MQNLLGTALGQIENQSWIRSSPSHLTSDHRTMELCGAEKIQSGNVSRIVEHDTMIAPTNPDAYPSCYVAVGTLTWLENLSHAGIIESPVDGALFSTDALGASRGGSGGIIPASCASMSAAIV